MMTILVFVQAVLCVIGGAIILLQQRTIRRLEKKTTFNHGEVIGQLTGVKMDEQGLWMQGQMNETGMTLITRDALKGLSIGPDPVPIVDRRNRPASLGSEENRNLFYDIGEEPYMWCEKVKNKEEHPTHWHVIQDNNITYAQGQCPGYSEDEDEEE